MKIRVALLTSLLAFGVLFSGCISQQMLNHGWSVRHTANAMGHDDYEDPRAEKKTPYVLEFEYSQRVVPYNSLGVWSIRRWNYRLERVTNTATTRDLRIADVMAQEISLLEADRYPVGEQVSEGPLPIIRYNRTTGTMPDQECILWARDWYWYIPPRHSNDIPRIGRLTQDYEYTPFYAYPLRIVALPAFVVGDIIFWPIFVIAVQFADQT